MESIGERRAPTSGALHRMGRANEGERMATNQSAEDHVADLNCRSFAAENNPRTARHVLTPLLADDFYIERGGGAMQDKEAMLQATEDDATRRVRSIEDEARDVSVRVYGTGAVARTLVTVHEANNALVGRFWNSKVFVAQESASTGSFPRPGDRVSFRHTSR